MAALNDLNHKSTVEYYGYDPCPPQNPVLITVNWDDITSIFEPKSENNWTMYFEILTLEEFGKEVSELVMFSPPVLWEDLLLDDSFCYMMQYRVKLEVVMKFIHELWSKENVR